jgi:hypothetical protein
VTHVLVEAGASLSAVDNMVIKPSVKLIRPLPPLEPLSPLCFPPLLTGVEVSSPKTICSNRVIELNQKMLILTRFVTKNDFFM